MLKRNLLSAGDYVEPIPVGIPVTLQYRAVGTLEKVLLKYPIKDNLIEDGAETCKELLSELLKRSKVPTHISTNNGTLFVEGVIYTDKHSEDVGTLFDHISKDLTYIIASGQVDFNFFAGNVISTTVKFSGISQIRNWLKLQGFNILPSCLIPVKQEEAAIKKSLELSGFKYDMLLGYFVFNRGVSDHIILNKSQDIVDRLEVYLDSSGCVRCNVYFKNLKSAISISYFEMIFKDLQVGDFVILDDSRSKSKIITRYPVPTSAKTRGEYTCPFCGKIYVVDDEFSKCPDIHCVSRMYPDVSHFLHRLQLPALEYSRYIELVQAGKFSKFSNVMDLPELRDVMIETTFYDILDAIIPTDVVRNRDIIWQLCMACNNSWESIAYYLNHPMSIESDLKIQSKDLVNWFLDVQNVESVEEILQYANVVITTSNKKFEGSPIFRGKNIWITGKFIHGSNAEIESILRSYSANVTDYELADCAIIGDIPEGVDGGKVSKLKNRNKPIFSETEFFNMYDIDSDLK